jgi:hypothetical protein
MTSTICTDCQDTAESGACASQVQACLDN